MPYRQSLQIMAIFAILGPPTGGFALVALSSIQLGELTFLLRETYLIFVGGYMIGGIPALLTGWACGRIAARKGSVWLWQSWVLAATAIFVSLAVFLIISSIFIEKRLPTMEKNFSDAVSMLLTLLMAGLPATTVCWGCARWRGLL